MLLVACVPRPLEVAPSSLVLPVKAGETWVLEVQNLNMGSYPSRYEVTLKPGVAAYRQSGTDPKRPWVFDATSGSRPAVVSVVLNPQTQRAELLGVSITLGEGTDPVSKKREMMVVVCYSQPSNNGWTGQARINEIFAELSGEGHNTPARLGRCTFHRK